MIDYAKKTVLYHCAGGDEYERGRPAAQSDPKTPLLFFATLRVTSRIDSLCRHAHPNNPVNVLEMTVRRNQICAALHVHPGQ